MSDKGSKKPVDTSANKARKLEDVTDLDHLDDLDDLEVVPASNVYTRTGKAAPTEVLPAAPKSAPRDKPVDISVDRVDEPAVDAAAKPATSAEPAVKQPVEEPVAASTVSTAGTLHTTEGAESLTQESAASTADVAGAPQPQPPIGRGTIDVGLLILRLVLGGVLILTSLAVLFQLGGNAGLAGLEDELASYNYPHLLAIALPSMGLGAGVFLVLGLLTPVASMVAVAATGFTAINEVMTSESTSDIFAWEPSVWLAIALAGMALAVQFTGPGLFGIDFSRSWTRRPMASSWICAAFGIAAAVLLWVFA